MSEQYIPSPPSPETNKEAPNQKTEDDFTVIDEFQRKERDDQNWQAQAAEHARNIMSQEASSRSESKPDTNGWSTKAKVTAGILMGLAAGSGATAVAADHILPGQDIASATVSIKQGEGVEQTVNHALDALELQNPTISPADLANRQDVISQAVAMHEVNGVVEPGEAITVVAEKSPVYGRVTYEAVSTERTDKQ